MILVTVGILGNIFRMAEQDYSPKVRTTFIGMTSILTLLVYTKLAPPVITASIPTVGNDGAARQNSLPETIKSSIFTVMNQDNTITTQILAGDLHNVYDANTPAPLNTLGGNQRAVSAPHGSLQSTAMTNTPIPQKSINMAMENARLTGQDSPVITETLGVIDEHITEMNTPRSSLLASPRNKGNDSGSEYSSHVDHRLSYITGNETDEEDTLTPEQVVNWNPRQAAQYLHEIGVEQRHCDIFQEQEITGEVLLNLEKSELFMPELDLGPIGRRLATWHKIKAFQEEVKSKRGAATPSVTGSTSASVPSVNGSSFARTMDPAYRSASYRYSQQNSPMILEDDSSLLIQSVDPAARPSAAAARELNHSRRHSSMDYAKSDRGTPPVSPGTSTQPFFHRPQGSFDKNWTLPTVPISTGGKPPRASTMLGFGALGMVSPGLPLIGDRRAMTSSTVDLAKKQSAAAATDIDRGYLSSGEAESGRSKIRNLLRKSQPNSANHSRQNSGNNDTRSILSTGTSATKRHSRFGSAGSIFGTLDRQLEFHPTLGHQTVPPSPPLSRTDSKALARAESTVSRSRTLSLRNSSSASGPNTATTLAGVGIATFSPSTPLTAPAAIANASTTADATPLVTKLDYAESPTSLTSKSNPVSPIIKSESFGPLSRMTSTLRSGKRSSSEAVTNIEKSQISSPMVPSTVAEAPLQSPARTGSTSPSAASKSIEMDTTPDTSIKGAAPMAATRAISGSKRSKNKKDTSAYKSLQTISPEQAIEGCSHSGWMHKKSAKMTSTFKSRYFVLKDKRLSYFYTLEDTVEKGLIDINAHRVEQVEHDLVTSLYATLSGTKSGPTSPAYAPSATGTTTPNATQSQAGPFFFKLVPPKTGLSRAVQFTRPAVHFFAVDNYEEGREWFLALKKASIDRDESQPVATTYSQKTISLAKAQEQRHRPPALMNTEELPEPKMQDTNANSEEPVQINNDALTTEESKSSPHQVSQVSAEYIVNEHPVAGATIPHEGPMEVTAEDTAGVAPVSETASSFQRPQSEQPNGSMDDQNKTSPTLRLVRSLSGGLGQHNEVAEEILAD